MVPTNIKVIPYIIFHNDMYEYFKCKLRILFSIIFHNNKGGQFINSLSFVMIVVVNFI
jgi:hypothetical protein